MLLLLYVSQFKWLHFTNLHANCVKSLFVPTHNTDKSKEAFRDKEVFVGSFVEIKQGQSCQTPAHVAEMC